MPDTQLPLDASWPLPDRRVHMDRRRTSRGGRRITDADDAPLRVSCPHCGEIASFALPHHQTLAEQRTDGFWRRRECAGCYQVYSTEERVTWQPIGTAPSSTVVLVHLNGYVGKGFQRNDGRWMDVEWGRDEAFYDPPPTEWMPLPHPPIYATAERVEPSPSQKAGRGRVAQ